MAENMVYNIGRVSINENTRIDYFTGPDETECDQTTPYLFSFIIYAPIYKFINTLRNVTRRGCRCGFFPSAEALEECFLNFLNVKTCENPNAITFLF